MVRSMSMLSGLACAIVEAKFPEEFYDPCFAKTVFDVIELVGDELAKKNFDIFVSPFINQLVDVKDVAYGDKVNFIICDEVEPANLSINA